MGRGIAVCPVAFSTLHNRISPIGPLGVKDDAGNGKRHAQQPISKD